MKTGTVFKIHSCNDGQDDPRTFAQIWMVKTADNSQYMVSIRKGDRINFIAEGDKITKIGLRGEKVRHVKRKTK